MVNAALESMGIDEPVIVGHSISSGIASIYAASYPVRGLVNIDGTVDIQQTAALVQRLEPVLRSERFAAAFEPFQAEHGIRARARTASHPGAREPGRPPSGRARLLGATAAHRSL